MNRKAGIRALKAAAERLRFAGQCFLERDGDRINLIGFESDILGGIQQVVDSFATMYEVEA